MRPTDDECCIDSGDGYITCYGCEVGLVMRDRSLKICRGCKQPLWDRGFMRGKVNFCYECGMERMTPTHNSNIK